MSQFETIIDNPNFKRAIAQQFDPELDYSEMSQAELDGAFEATVYQLLLHYKQSQADFQESNQMPETGDTVIWQAGTAQVTGTVAKVFTDPKTLTIKGHKVSRAGSEEDPALLINTSYGRDLKLVSEVTISQEIANHDEPVVGYSFDFDGRYDDIDLKPTKGMVESAQQALKYINSGHGGAGLENETIRWVKKVAHGDPLSIEKCKKGYKFFKRQNFYKLNAKPNDTNPSSPAPWYVARLCWFGDDGESFFNRVWKQIKAADFDSTQGASLEYSEFTLDFGSHITKIIPWYGHKIGLELSPGDTRFQGKPHERVLKSGYGHIRNLRGNDGEALDCYLAPAFFDSTATPTSKAFVVKQLIPNTGEFDEEKVMVGYPDLKTARQAYLDEMPEQYFGGIGELKQNSLPDFHKDSDSKPSEEHITGIVNEILQPHLRKIDQLLATLARLQQQSESSDSLLDNKP